MLVIRDAQIQALIAAADEDIVDAVEKAVRRAAPNRVKGIVPERVRGMVERCVKRARSAGFEKTEDIGAFAAIMFVVSPRFNEIGPIADVLADARFTAGERLFQLFGRVPDDDWKAAERTYNAQFWFNESDEPESSGDASEPADTGTLDYKKLAAQQADAVEAAQKHAKEAPGERSAKQLEVEVEKLCFCLTAAAGHPKKRALRAAEAARAAVLGKVVANPPRGVQ